MTQFIASMEEYPSMLLWLLQHLSKVALDAAVSQKMQLAFEEAVVNVIHHAYQDQGGMIELSFHKDAAKITVSIADEGPFFDPLQHTPPTLDPLEERPPGGFGVFFIKQCVDEVFYTRKGERNILTLSIFLKRGERRLGF